MCKAGGHFAQSGEVFGARHLSGVPMLDFFPALTELDDHLVEVGKNDGTGAIASWQKLLKLHPNYEHQDTVEKLIAEAKTHTGKTLPQSE